MPFVLGVLKYTPFEFWRSTPAELGEAITGHEANRKREVGVVALQTAQILAPHVKNRSNLFKRIYNAMVGSVTRSRTRRMSPKETAEAMRQKAEEQKARARMRGKR